MKEAKLKTKLTFTFDDQEIIPIFNIDMQIPKPVKKINNIITIAKSKKKYGRDTSINNGLF